MKKLSKIHPPPESKFRTVLRSNILPSLTFSSVIGLIVGAAICLIFNIRYGDIWYSSGIDRSIHFVYLIGQYSGWLLVSCLSVAVLMGLTAIIIPKSSGLRNPNLFYFMLVLFMQVLFWVELVNYTFYFSRFSASNAKLSYITVFLVLFALFVLLYNLLKKRVFTKRRIIERGGITIISASLLAVILFIASFFLPPIGAMKSAANPRLDDKYNYDVEGDILLDDFQPPKKLYNILLLSIDTLRGDGLGCYGYDKPVSPFIDSLAQGGIIFRNAYSTSPWTLPAHGTIFTSLHPTEHGALRRSLPQGTHDKIGQSALTITEILKKAGYNTVAFTANAYVSADYGFDRGFDVYDSDSGNVSFLKAVDFLKDYDTDTPFFMFLHTYIVHDYNPADKYEIMFCDTSLSKRRESILNLRFFRQHNNFNLFNRFPERAEYLRNLYDATIREVDDLFSEVVGSIVQQKLMDNTIIIILSDHGEEFWDHGGADHCLKFYEEMLRIPLIMLLPPEMGFSNMILEDRVSLLDIMPTILELNKLPPCAKARGVSLLPVLKGEPISSRKLYIEGSWWGNKLGVIDGDYKYIFNRLPPIEKKVFYSDWFPWALNPIMHFSKDELYNIVEDSLEKENIIEANPDIAAELREDALEQFLIRFSGFPRGDFEVEKNLKKETLERLKALGYVH